MNKEPKPLTPPHLHGHRLHPVADPEDGNAQLKHGGRGASRPSLGNGRVAARQNDAARPKGPDKGVADVKGVNLAVDVRFAQSARN